ncbi:MAG: hypothetical protein ACYC35_03615 [Pirellulales bacterium]
MNWFKVQVVDGSERFTFVGCCQESLETLSQKATRHEYIRLDQLLYNDRGAIKDWTEWDNRVLPSVYINPDKIVSLMQFKDDPRVIPRSAG